MKKSTLTQIAVLLFSGLLVAGCSDDDMGINSSVPDVLSAPNTVSTADAAHDDGMRVYQVTIMNMSYGQPLSPPVVSTHGKGISMFKVDETASLGLEAIAENGDNSLMVSRFSTSPYVTDVVNVGMPLTRRGTTVGSFKDYVSFEISARKKDRLSLATMLICSNDAFTGLNSVKLPEEGRKTYFLKPYDAGTEENTERSSDIVDACSGLGAVGLAGDPNGNENDAVDTYPHMNIRKHRGTQGNGDLDANTHTIEKKVVKVVIELISGGEEDDDDDDDDDDD